MVNSDDFIKRLESVLDYYNLSASAFADKIGVQRSSLSHLLSGRNKPSLDFIIKVIEVFPEVDLYWILNGRGNFPRSESELSSASRNQKYTPYPTEIDSSVLESDLFSSTSKKSDTTAIPLEANTLHSNETDIVLSEEIERIVVFFKNGTFKNYQS